MSIILPNTGKDVAVSTAQKICERVAQHKFKLANGKDTNVTISLGVSTFPFDGDTASSLIDSADKRLLGHSLMTLFCLYLQKRVRTLKCYD